MLYAASVDAQEHEQLVYCFQVMEQDYKMVQGSPAALYSPGGVMCWPSGLGCQKLVAKMAGRY